MECGARYNVGWACVGWMTRSASTSSSRAWWEPRQKCTPPPKVIIDGASLPGWRELHQLPPRDTTAHDVQDGVHYHTAAMLLGSSAAACRAARRRQQRFEDRPLCVGHRRRVHRATMSTRRVGRGTTGMARSAMMALWAPGLGGDLVITDPTRSRLLRFSARHTPAIASPQTLSKWWTFSAVQTSRLRFSCGLVVGVVR